MERTTRTSVRQLSFPKRARAIQQSTNRKSLINRLRRTPNFYGAIPQSSPEKKVQDTAATVNVNTTGSFTLLHIPVLGSDFNNRIGRKTLIKSFYIRGYVQTEASASPANPQFTVAQQCRMIVFVDNQPNAAAPAVTDLLVTATPQSQLNLNNRDRFKVVTDKVFVLDPYSLSTTATQAVASQSNQIRAVKKFKSMNLETIFNSTNGGTIADITSGALYMFWIGNVAAGASTDANFVGTQRVRFHDA